MKMKHFASVAAIAATLAIATAQTAAASTTVYASNGTYAQLDNNPSGAASWIWWFGGAKGETWVDYKFYNDGNVHRTGTVGAGVAASITPNQDVWQIRVCNHYYAGQDNITSCSSWS
jgi:hypothetical protein